MLPVCIKWRRLYWKGLRDGGIGQSFESESCYCRCAMRCRRTSRGEWHRAGWSIDWPSKLVNESSYSASLVDIYNPHKSTLIDALSSDRLTYRCQLRSTLHAPAYLLNPCRWNCAECTAMGTAQSALRTNILLIFKLQFLQRFRNNKLILHKLLKWYTRHPLTSSYEQNILITT